MAFEKNQFNTIATLGALAGKALQLHAYVTNEAAAAVETSGFFNDAAHAIETGDQIMVSIDIDGTLAVKHYGLTNTSGVITVTAAAA